MAAPPVPAGPSPAELAAEKQRAEISKLLTLAQADLKANRLTTPKDNNALSRYEAVLERDPQNAEAQQGIDAVANRYATLAAMSIDNGDLDKAASLLERGRKANSDSDSLDRVADRLRTAREEAAKEKAAAAEAAKEKAAAEEAAREQAAQEEAAREQAAKEQAAKEQAAREEAEKQRQLALAQPPPPAAPPPAPSVAITFDGFKHDYDRFGLTTAKLRQEAAVRLQKAGYVVAGSSPASLYARFKLRIVVNTTSGIASYSTHLDIAGSPWTPTASPLVEWQSGQSGTMRSFEIGRLNEIYIKLIERFIQERPPARQ